MEYKPMKEYSHEEFVNLILNLTEDQILELSTKYGGYPVLFRKSLDERIKHIPFIQPGAAVVVRNENDEILLQQRADNGKWGLPGGCQELGEDLRVTAVRELYEETGLKAEENDLVLINVFSGNDRKKIYPNGDIVYNNSALYLYNVNSNNINIKKDLESIELEFFDINNLPTEMHDGDLIAEYVKYIRE